MSQKLLIVVLVVIVVIFVITVGIGGCHASGSGKDPDHAGFVGALKGLRGKRFLKIGDKATVAPPSCALGPTTLRINGNSSCTVTLQKRAFFKKPTRVAFTTTAPITVFVNPKSGPQITKTRNAFQCFGTAVDRAGGTIQISGTTGNTATITFVQTECPKE
jgi:hypothetical protein